MEHQAREREERPAFDRLRQPFVILGQAAEPGGPGKAALDHSTPGQQHKPAFGLLGLDDHQVDAVLGGRLARGIPGMPLIDVGHVYRLARCLFTASAKAATWSRS